MFWFSAGEACEYVIFEIERDDFKEKGTSRQTCRKRKKWCRKYDETFSFQSGYEGLTLKKIDQLKEKIDALRIEYGGRQMPENAFDLNFYQVDR